MRDIIRHSLLLGIMTYHFVLDKRIWFLVEILSSLGPSDRLSLELCPRHPLRYVFHCNPYVNQSQPQNERENLMRTKRDAIHEPFACHERF